ncbi:MAG: type II toxin-antitoxin system PemK/MazF family toxin [Spirochaetaceae bacterium]|jgi:mRNA interferase MazF|nr:type II toxin-antitoxin system PemK/MazF family toxin [Spirochaetaceae bacterium]
MVKQGYIIWLDFDPQIGHEQRGRRPALVISNEVFNNFSSLAIVCLITNTVKSYPFHIKLDERTKTTGVILCDQARTLDINARNFEYIELVPEDILLEVLDIITGFIEIENKENE